MRESIGPAEALSWARSSEIGGFVAIDFETATRYRSSACAVGLAIVEAGQVTQVEQWLIRPPDNEYEGMNISIHGITPKMTKSSPSMAEVWPLVAEKIGRRLMVAHYAAFDLSVIRASLSAARLGWPDLSYVCTRALARATWPGQLSYRLPDVAHPCGINFQHHDAGDDAAAAAEIALACAGTVGAFTLIEAAEELRVGVGRLSSSAWTPSGLIHSKISELEPTVTVIDSENPFFDNTVVFTGALTMVRADAAQLVVNAGGHCATSMSKKVRFLVLGAQDPHKVVDGVHSSKMLRAQELLNSGVPIEVLSESDFFRMVESG